MKRLTVILAVLSLSLLAMPSAQASVSSVRACKTYHSFNGNAKVSICVSAIQDNTNDRIWVYGTATHVTGFQNPVAIYMLLRNWTSHTTGDPWCDGRGGRDGPCTGGGDNSVYAGVPIVLNTAQLTPFEHFCYQHGEAVLTISWPGGGSSTPKLNSPSTDTIGAGCWP